MNLTREKLIELFSYNPENGEFRWRHTGKGIPWHGVAGSPNQQGQILICIDLKRHLAHRLAWLYVHGEPVPKEIDHINGDCSDNAIVNLRETTHSHNLANSKTRIDNTSGCKGVCWDKQKSKWKVQVGPAGKRVQKHFYDLEDAEKFARAESLRIFGEFSRV